MEKISKLIKEKSLTPKDALYHTKRQITNKKREKSGRLRVLVLKEDGIARVEYTCPECGHEGYLEKEWKRPFSFNCEKCSVLIRVPKMKDQAKKEMKSEA